MQSRKGLHVSAVSFTHFPSFARLGFTIQKEQMVANIRGNTAFQIERAERNRKPVPKVTPRQSEILKMVAMGYTNREIASSLEISVRTVEVHRFNLMRRLNARNVAQLLRQSLRNGLLPRNFGGR
jgi:two-component system secretion response regulator SsrB